MTNCFKHSFYFLITSLFFSSQLTAQETKYYGGEAGKKLDWTVFYLDAHYVDSTDVDKLAELAIVRMVQELDPFSKYQSKEQLDIQRKADKGYKNDGIGLQYFVVNDTATITYIDEMGPSMTAGLLKGDKILSVNGINTVGQNYKAIDTLILASSGTVINFNVRRSSKIAPLDIAVTSVSLFAASVDAAYKIEGNIGYIRLNRYTFKTFGEMEKAINNLKQQGVEHLILDLRGNTGGVVDGATKLADQFLEEGKLMMTSEGKGMPKTEAISTAEGFFKKGKLAILTNSFTASASEIFTGALQEWDRALVVGEVTYGKGLIQQSYWLGDSSAVRLTIGRYYTPTGRILQRPFHFDTSTDWINKNITSSVHHDGLTTKLLPPEDYRWKTKSGRKILKGLGGIIPDVYTYLPVIDKPQLSELNDAGLTYKFAVYHADKFRDYYLHTWKDGNDFRQDFTVDDPILNSFSTFLAENMPNKDRANSILKAGISPHVMTQIKAWMAPQIWEIGSYYSVFNEEDEVVLRAIRAIKDDTFDKVGIKY